jgi:hypothetical protein
MKTGIDVEDKDLMLRLGLAAVFTSVLLTKDAPAGPQLLAKTAVEIADALLAAVQSNG